MISKTQQQQQQQNPNNQIFKQAKELNGDFSKKICMWLKGTWKDNVLSRVQLFWDPHGL